MIAYRSQVKELEAKIERQKSLIRKAKHFNRKLELNVELNRVEVEFRRLKWRLSDVF